MRGPLAKGLHYRVLRALFERVPALSRLAGVATDSIMKVLIGPQVPVPQAANTYTQERLIKLTDELNLKAEQYFSTQSSEEFRDFLLRKPFSDADHFAEHLFSVGTMVHWLRLRPGDRVLEIGAGSGWLSHLLNQYGCETVTVDVSATVLELARHLFGSSSHTNWSLHPEFATFDGWRLPLPDASVDRIVVYDAFHHIPNQAAVLSEMSRVLRPGGITAMSEPGRRHSLAQESLDEVELSGVLENDIVVEELDVLARRHGFSRTTVVPLSLASSIEVDSAELVSFLRGRGFQRFWTRQAQSLLSEHFILLYKGTPIPDTRRPSLTRAQIQTPTFQTVRQGRPWNINVQLANTGDTTWLTGDAARPGTTRLGFHLNDHIGTNQDWDWHRLSIPHEMAPGDKATLSGEMPALPEPGVFQVELDMVSERVCWFGERGSTPTTVTVTVTD
ncbi:MAG: class I SAM-dependent methyltransferase [Acidimicrobiales bacterium]